MHLRMLFLSCRGHVTCLRSSIITNVSYYRFADIMTYVPGDSNPLTPNPTHDMAPKVVPSPHVEEGDRAGVFGTFTGTRGGMV